MGLTYNILNYYEFSEQYFNNKHSTVEFFSSHPIFFEYTGRALYTANYCVVEDRKVYW